MATNFPASLDDSVTLPDPGSGDYTDAPSHASQHSTENAAIKAVEAKIGVGASTPTTGRVFRGTGSGTSAWAQVVLTTDVTGTLPVANGGTGITSLGTGVATFMATPSSANLSAAVTDETGTGALVFGTSPTIVTPTVASFTNAQHNHSNAAGGGKISSTGIDFGGAGAGIWYEEIGRTTLLAGATTMGVSFAARKYLRIYILMIPSATINPGFQWNGDTAANYSSRLSTNGGADSTAVSQTMNFLDVAASQNLLMYTVIDTLNITGQEKISSNIATTVGAAGAATAPTRREQLQKWANTSAQITSILVSSTTGNNFAIGSEVIVLGHD